MRLRLKQSNLVRPGVVRREIPGLAPGFEEQPSQQDPANDYGYWDQVDEEVRAVELFPKRIVREAKVAPEHARRLNGQHHYWQ